MGDILELFQYFNPMNADGINWEMIVMWIIGGVLIYLAIAKEMEPTLLLPMGFGPANLNCAK